MTLTPLEWFNLLTLMWWVAIMIFAIEGVYDHYCYRGKYKRAAVDERFSAGVRKVYAGWARDEQARMGLKMFLLMPSIVFVVIRILDSWNIDAPGSTDLADLLTSSQIFLRLMLIVGIGGAIQWCTRWRYQVRRDRAERAPRLNARATAPYTK